jgi:hypothetical protein
MKILFISLSSKRYVKNKGVDQAKRICILVSPCVRTGQLFWLEPSCCAALVSFQESRNRKEGLKGRVTWSRDSARTLGPEPCPPQGSQEVPCTGSLFLLLTAKFLRISLPRPKDTWLGGNSAISWGVTRSDMGCGLWLWPTCLWAVTWTGAQALAPVACLSFTEE